MTKKTGYIYALSSPYYEKIYIGSTTQNLKYRLSNHKTDFKNKKNLTASKVLKHPQVKIVKLLKIKFENRNELYEIEKEIIRENKNKVVNKIYNIK
jgi:hypothetical protein